MKSNSSKRLNELIEYFGITQTDIAKKNRDSKIGYINVCKRTAKP